MSPLFRVLAGFTLAVLVGLCLMLAGCGGKSPVPDAGAQSRTITYTWVNPTTRTNGVALPASQIAGTDVRWGTSQGGPYANTASATGAAQTLAVTLPTTLTCGTVYAVAVTKATDGTQSVPTGEVAFVVGACAPNPPTNFAAN